MTCILSDAYANAFNREANGMGHQKDKTEMSPMVWERKYEIDSLCYPVKLAYRFWKDADTGYMHESFHKDKPQKFTREWFSWANTLFAELIIKYLSEDGKI